jgi:hypothetical protein
MAITLKRQLDDHEKQTILKRFGRNCFATGHAIPEGESLHFDHIRAFALGGPSELDNIAPMCEQHNKAKGTLPLEDFRVSLRLKEFFAQGDGLTLGNLLAYLKSSGDIASYGNKVSISQSNGTVTIEDLKGIKRTQAVHQCPTTGWQYFYATLPIELLDSDDKDQEKVGLQPRYLIFDKVFGLFRHFQNHPVLQPSIGRVRDSQVVLFDGQHKIAALLWTGRREFECKIYIDPELHVLNQTNIAAHDNFSQTRFFASIMVAKLGSEFGTEFEKYKLVEDGSVKSEAGFMQFLEKGPTQSMTRADRNKRFRNYLYNSVLQHPENRMGEFVSKGNRSTDEKPLTIDQLTKSIFANFLYTDPVDENMATDLYKRDKEIDNIVLLMNMIHDLALHSWNAGTGKNDTTQRKLFRLFGSKSMMAWSELLRDAICGKLDLNDADDRARPLYRELTQAETERMKKIVERLVNFPIWVAPLETEVDRALSDNKSALKDWLKAHGLTTGYLMGASE